MRHPQSEYYHTGKEISVLANASYWKGLAPATVRERATVAGIAGKAQLTEVVNAVNNADVALQAAMAAGAFAGPAADGLGFGLGCVLDGIGVLIARRGGGSTAAG